MNRKSIVITCLLTVSALICAGTVKAQNCETSEPVFYVGFISTLDNDAVGKSLECLNRTVSITAHYVVISPGDTIPVADTIIDTLLYKINQLFEPICLSFQICTEQMVPRDDYFFLNDSAGYQYQDVMVVEYNVPKTLNIYFIDHFLMDTAKCGYATLPVIPCQEEEG
ncbi:MAG: hypothetical protein KJ607_01390, partial [Bacteroidetes bacterium]|nr:hypothetical protein [Bacteroidota bacterium]